MLPPNPQDVITASRRGKGRIVAFWVTLGVVFVIAAGVGIFLILRDVAIDIGKGLNLAPLFEAGAVQARSADETAIHHHLWDGALTLDLLNDQHSDVRWIPGNDPVAVSGKRTDVSVSVGGDHVVTAVNEALCSYGIAVSAPNDPIIAQDQLPGVGTYWTFNSGAPEKCSADSAPSTGWSRFG